MNKSNFSLTYRPEIDGLRAFAVIPVIFFHAGFKLFSGGFVGVDVFFVISGYLITSIILSEMEVGKFSLINFYERRARRILPALFFVTLICVPFSWMLLISKDMKDFAQSLIAISTFSSNILFWRESGYFNTAAELKPLLHTWSLAVEEQYYLLYPLFLILAWRLGKRWILALLTAAILVSLSLGHWGAYNKPHAAFYLLPTRAWEILIGIFAAFYLSRTSLNRFNNKASNTLGIIGLALIMYSIFFYNKTTPVPSLYLLIPTVGTLLIIVFAHSGTIVSNFLSNRIFIWIGLISYSAYLWHQPLFAFIKYLSFDDHPSASIMALCCLLVIPLAYLSWRFVEKPFRNKSFIKRKNIFFLSIVVATIIITFGLVINKRIEVKNYNIGVLNSASAKVVVVGDSHATHLLYGLKKYFDSDISAMIFSGCIPFYNVDRYDSRFPPRTCSTAINNSLKDIENNQLINTIILSSMGPVYLTGEAFKGKDPARVKGNGVVLITNPKLKDKWLIYEIAMRNTLERFTLLNKKVVFVIDVPELGFSPRFCHVNNSSLSIFGRSFKFRYGKEDCFVSRKDFNDRNDRYRKFIYNILKDYPTIKLFDPTEIFCDYRKCHAIKDGKILYRDFDHLSIDGSELVAKHLIPIIRETLR